MLMGQINHARNRIKVLTAEKLGNQPDWPEVPTEKDFRDGVREGNITITPALLKNAIEAWTTRAPRLEVCRASSQWDYNSRTHVRKPARIETRNTGDLPDYLAYVYFQKKYEAAVAVYEAELLEYNRRKALIDSEATEVEDAIVLGDNAAALAALQKFAAFTV
jgi:hypothetical protein